MKKDKPEKKGKKEKEPVVKSLTPDERKRILIEGIKKTVVATFIGTFFAVLFYLKFNEAVGTNWVLVLLLVVLISYYFQRFLYPLLGIKVKEFEIKDWMYVELLTIIFMLIVWIILLNP